MKALLLSYLVRTLLSQIEKIKLHNGLQWS